MPSGLCPVLGDARADEKVSRIMQPVINVVFFIIDSR